MPELPWRYCGGVGGLGVGAGLPEPLLLTDSLRPVRGVLACDCG